MTSLLLKFVHIGLTKLNSADCLDIGAARTLLDNDHYAMEKLKRRVLEYLAVRQLKTSLKVGLAHFITTPPTLFIPLLYITTPFINSIKNINNINFLGLFVHVGPDPLFCWPSRGW